MKEKSKSSIVVRIKPKAKDIYLYKMSNSFANITGLYRLLTSAAFIISAFACYGKTDAYVSIILMVIGLLNPVVTPVWHWFSSLRLQSKLASNIYGFAGTKISINDGKDRLQLEWHDLYQVILSKRLLLIYIAPGRAFIIPKDQLGTELEALEEHVKNNSNLCKTKYRNFL